MRTRPVSTTVCLVLALGVGSRVLAEESTGGFGESRVELHRLVLADAAAAAPTGRRSQSAPLAARGGSEKAAVSRAGDEALPPRPHETPGDRFFRTGVLASLGEKPAAAKLTFGPCQDGQLLNLRTAW